MDSLFPKTDADLAAEALAEIRKVLNNERRMREWVFRSKPDVRQAKVREIDGALRKLEVLESLIRKGGLNADQG